MVVPFLAHVSWVWVLLFWFIGDAMRYLPSVPLPQKRFIPGEGPRPGHEEDVHSQANEGKDLGRVPDATDLAYLRGLDLFNHDFWWEAHEAWEEAWHRCPRDSDPRGFLQALILLAAFFLLRHIGRDAAAMRVRERAVQNLDEIVRRIKRADPSPATPQLFLRLDVASLVQRARGLSAPAPTGETPLRLVLHPSPGSAPSFKETPRA